MTDCIFCKIINGEIPSNKVFESDTVLAFRDINPQAPVHVVIIPKVHIASANELCAENISAVTDIFSAIPEIAKAAGVAESGYRIINNCGEDGGQTVRHLHFHMLGGKNLGEGLV